MKNLERRIGDLEHKHDGGAVPIVVVDDPPTVAQLERIAELQATGKPYLRLSRSDAGLRNSREDAQ